MKKKILFVITKSNFGGAQRYVADLADGLSQEYSVAVACGGRGVLVDKLEAKGIRTIPILSLQRDVSITKDIKAFFELISIFKKEKPDIVHLNSSKIGAMGGLAARIAGVPKIVFTGHGWAFNEKRPWVQKKVILFLHWLTIIFSHTTIAVAEKIKKDISVLPFISKKIRVVYNGLGPIEFVEKNAARELLGIGSLSADTLVIGTISELHSNKGLDIALKGFSEFHKTDPASHFVIVGEGEQRKELEMYIKNNNLSSSVTLCGFVKDAAKYVKAFDIFTLTSRTEAFPYVPLEAGLANIPVIASRVGGIPEAIIDGESGILVESGNPQSFTKAIETLATDPALRSKLAQNLHNTVTSKFSLKNTLEATKRVYEGLV